MNKFRDDSNSQCDDIVTWFRSLPGLIFSGIVLVGFGGWFVVNIILDLIAQGAA